MKTQITPLKLARYPELLTGKPRPIHWDIDPSSVCDHRCQGCPYIFDGPVDPMLGVVRPESAKDKRTFLDYARLIHFFDEAKALGCKAITFVGGGEPTLHPRITEILRAAHERKIKFGIVTHLGRDYSGEFFDAASNATWIRVSVNAGTQETYEDHQGRDDFDRAIANAELLAKQGPRVGLSFLVTPKNYDEAALATQIAKAAGCAYIQFKPMISPDLAKIYAGCEVEIRDNLDAALEYADDSFQVLDQFVSRLAELERHDLKEFSGKCWVPWFNPKLGANGVVYTCCELAYSNEGKIGSIYEEPLESILERAGDGCMEMSACPHCWDKSVNTIINEGRLGGVIPPPASVDQEFV